MLVLVLSEISLKFCVGQLRITKGGSLRTDRGQEEFKENTGVRKLGSIDEILKVSYDLNERLARTTDPDCKANRRVIFTPSNGIGNRLLAVVSTVMFAVMSDRVLELNWKVTKDCGHSYHQLFHPMKEPHTLRAFIPDIHQTARLPNVVTRNETKCELDLERQDLTHFYFFKDLKLFDRLNNECHVVFMRYNHYFANLLGELTREYVYIHVCSLYIIILP